MKAPVIIGGGLAGLSVALALQPKPVVILCRKMATSMTSSELAQGGIAAAVGPDDSLRLHEQDTLTAGAGLCDPQTVKKIIGEGPTAIERLSIWGVAFDRDARGNLKTGLEGAHSRRRIAHANGDSTGAAVMKSLVARVKATPSITIIEDAEVLSLLTDDRGVCGVLFLNNQDHKPYFVKTRQAVLATGGACALWRHATVPHGSWGHGLLLAARAGAKLRDIEFAQFHPTVLDVGLDPMPLISEALRGEGAKLINDKGHQFVGELNPRDIVARAIWSEIERGRKVYLDAQTIPDIRSRFPTIFDHCVQGGIDPREAMIPIRPAAHYHMGGVATDIDGCTNIEGLYACGEVACTGLHGANRLASNSLLEAVVMGCRVADKLRLRVSSHAELAIMPLDTGVPAGERAEDILRVRCLMSSHVGLRRSQGELESAIESLSLLSRTSQHALVALMIAQAALTRKESRGAHDRKDYPQTDDQQASSNIVTLEDNQIVLKNKQGAPQ